MPLPQPPLLTNNDHADIAALQGYLFDFIESFANSAGEAIDPTAYGQGGDGSLTIDTAVSNITYTPTSSLSVDGALFGTVDITFTLPDRAIGILVLYKEASEAMYHTSFAATSPTAVMSLKLGTVYNFYLVPQAANGSLGPASDVANVTFTTAVTVVTVPTDVVATATYQSIVVTWTAPVGGSLLTYQVQVANDALFTVALATYTVDVTYFVYDAGVIAITKYFRVCAIDKVGVASAYSGTVSASTLNVPDNSIITSKILDSNVTTAKIADLNVTTGKLADNAVTTVKITDLNVTTGKYAVASVTNAVLATMAAWTVKIRNAGTTGAPSDAAVADVTTATPVSTDFVFGYLSTGEIRKYLLSAIMGMSLPDGDKGDITVSGSGATWTINNDAVTYAKFQNVAGLSLVGRGSAGAGNSTDIGLTAGGGLEFLTTTSLGIADNAVTNLHLANRAGTSRVVGSSSTTNDPTDLTLGTGLAIAASVLDTAVVTGSGTYTPTLTGVANCDAVTAQPCQYLRVGSVVTVSGDVIVDPTTVTTLTQVGISLPIASNLAASYDCTGTAFAPVAQYEAAAIRGDAANDRAEMIWITGVTINTRYHMHFTYRII